MSLHVVRHSVFLAVKEFISQSGDVWGRGMQVGLHAAQAAAKSFLTKEVGTRPERIGMGIAVQPGDERVGSRRRVAQEVIDGTDRHGEAGFLGGALPCVPSGEGDGVAKADRKSTRLNSSHLG